MTCRTRFAPSPTGYLHIGGARTALYNWLEARRRDGSFVLRIEDTDRERSTPEATRAIIDGLAWLGLTADEGPIFQTDRHDRYAQVARDLVQAGKAYFAYESRNEIDAMREAAKAAGGKPRYDGSAREANHAERDDPNKVIRFKNPLQGEVSFDDKVKGRITFANSELDDLVLIRSDGFPTYNFAVVVDDIDMAISDVIRGDDHVNNTPRQVNLYEALGAPVPAFAHLPMILGPDGTKMSKRHGAVGVMQYRDDGYLPHAILNYLVRLGWSHGDDEIFSIAQMQALFRIEDVHASPARFDTAKLNSINQHYLRNDAPEDVARHLEWHLRNDGYDIGSGPAPVDVVVALRERVQTLKDMSARAAVWYQPLVEYDAAAVAKHLVDTARAPLLQARAQLAALPEWTVAGVDATLHAVATGLELGMGKVAQPLRVAITGTQVSPDIAQTVYLAGQAQALLRIDAAIEKLPAPASGIA